MISNQVLQNTIDGMKEISHLDLCVMDADGHEVAATQAVFGEAAAAIPDFAASPADSQAAGPFQFFKVFDENQLEYILVINGITDNSLLVGRMAAYQIQSLVGAFKEHYDKDSFMKNLLLDNLLLIDIYERAKKLHIQANAPRVVMLVETQYGRSRDRDRDALRRRGRLRHLEPEQPQDPGGDAGRHQAHRQHDLRRHHRLPGELDLHAQVRRDEP